MAQTQLNEVVRHLRTLRDAETLTEASDAQLLQRFTTGREEGAFAMLLRRHGAMVLNLSRRMLGNAEDAEDVFQAAFLLLAKKAGSIRKQASVGSWLYGVTHRLAITVKTREARRHTRERQAANLRDSERSGNSGECDVRAILDSALSELPERYRAALVLCYLEGRTHEEAARQLGCPLATLRTRVARGRKLLRDHLTRHGLTLSVAGVLALLVASTPPVAEAACPAMLIHSTLRLALSGEAIPALVTALAVEVTRAMFVTKIKIVTAAVLGLAFVAAGAVVLMRQEVEVRQQLAEGPKPEAPSPKPKPPAPAPAADREETVSYSGRVLGPEGRPVANAKLYMRSKVGSPWHRSPAPEYATTGPDGRFRFTVSEARLRDFTFVAATATNYGAGWVEVPAGSKTEDLTVRLVADDGPINGQIVDLQGRPVAGATLTVLQINAAVEEDIGPWLEAAKGKKGLSFDLEQQYLPRYTTALSPKVTTDAEGRFRLDGIGRNRLVRAQLDGPTIASQDLYILTRPGETITVTRHEGNREYGDPRMVTTYYGSSFRHVAAPTKPIVGVVRDRDTKKPLAGASIRNFKMAHDHLHYVEGQEFVRTTTDAQGRYRLVGMPKGEGNKIKVVPPDDQPYGAVSAEVHDTPGLDPVTVDFELKRGVWLEGKITDKVTGSAVRAGVEYVPIYSNPNRQDYSGFYKLFYHFGTVKEDGSYRVVGPPGPGMIAVYNQANHYLRVSQREDEYGSKKLSDEEYPNRLRGSNCGALSRVNPEKGVASVKCDVTLDPGWRLTGTVQGPDGKPLAGTRNFLLLGPWWDHEATKTAEFSAWFNPHETEEIFFRHPEKGLLGIAKPPKENGGSVTVRMEKGATVTGRLVDAEGKPRAGVELEVRFQPKGWGSWFDYLPEGVKTDREGRFRIEPLPVGHDFRLSDGKGELPIGDDLHLGHTKDLGDVRMKARSQ